MKYRPEDAFELAEGPPEGRAHLSDKVVRAQTQDLLTEIERLINLAYDSTYLEATLHCDSFHDGKNSFSDLGERYGYITSYVRRDCGTNCMRFSYRRPTNSGTLQRKNINMNTKSGYTAAAFKVAAHEYERELALMTEENYARLREQGKKLKEMNRKLRTIEIYKNAKSKDDE
ncbi:MAG: hypothetical protein G8D89_20845 [gamma proteobacterium symbiont of Clathrolucina costata]